MTMRTPHIVKLVDHGHQVQVELMPNKRKDWTQHVGRKGGGCIEVEPPSFLGEPQLKDNTDVRWKAGGSTDKYWP